jgi:tetraacyldisaccharide 4'-kinase
MLTFLSWIYLLGWKIKEWIYTSGIRASRKLDARVICVGNLTTGGTGKTPMVIYLAKTLRGEGHKVSVLTRGYKGKKKKPVTVISDGTGRGATVEEGGDEAVLMSDELTGVPIFASANRFAAGREAIRSFASDTLILDDGFQHLRLARDLNLLIIDGSNPFGGNRLLPAGRLREPVTGIRRADAVILSRVDQAKDVPGILNVIRTCHPAIPVFQAIHEAYDMEALLTMERMSVEKLRGRGVIALSGIGNPGALHGTLKSLGAEVKRELSYPDHHRYTREDLENIRVACDRYPDALLITTEKDGVRLRDGEIHDLPVWVLKIRIRMIEEEAWAKWLHEVLLKNKQSS